ncbi:protein containg RHS repeat-associated core domain [Longilinea arvoryzae]|uniref:Protein containg RHS repeat-associated core domain n=2 Tax=Longilinea arvoryzae TaxID=360412 RepID=A0A0K8MY23_9CHLR|nr:protein containg RHS repeat-associated core domain [Longilinea arvoryzae]
MRKGGSVYYLYGDHLPLQGASRGSTSLITDANGSSVSETRYEPYGQVYWQWGATQTDFGYTGQRLDGFGLMDYNARFYDPYLARFIQADTIIPQPGNPQAWDRYSYTYNNPVNYTDSTGHSVCDEYGNCYMKYGERIPNKSKTMPNINIIYSGVPFIDVIRYPTNGGNVTTNFGSHNTCDYGNYKNIGKGGYSKEDYLADWGIHPGVDIGKPENDTNIYSIYPGIVVFVGEDDKNGGNKVVIRHFYNGKSYYSMYYHLASSAVEVGDMVNRGYVVGVMGNTGTSDLHLHFEVRTQSGVGSQNNSSVFVFPGAASQWWANSASELQSNWIDISPRFGGYDDFMPVEWR